MCSTRRHGKNTLSSTAAERWYTRTNCPVEAMQRKFCSRVWQVKDGDSADESKLSKLMTVMYEELIWILLVHQTLSHKSITQ